MSPTSVNTQTVPPAGFTLVEVIVSMGLSAIVLTGILSGYTFLGRNLTRLVNRQDQEAKSRQAFSIFAKDVSVATQVTAGSDTALNLKTLTSGGSISNVVYSYNAATGTLTRTDVSSTKTLLTDLTEFSFIYLNGAVNEHPLASNGLPLSTAGVLGIKEVELKFTSVVGQPASGVRSSYTSVSPRLLLRNKALLQ
jgi:prepilin-type N-terminal cleavage/methylation domain-containing protein